ncbi:putative cytochrome c oxidase subunit 2 [Phycicoccus elongatus Lp2]|uniref:cytochrome-c oxidase n=1 Tax=Phycicoccus elongatus Lp2 TaxID=1193181 RepID=N0DYZ8_9MICO|nr:cytochrome c oxidase subunit II [Phycicoccus elongatus]CCH69803.1 putative cytochrome c oxidase subunit 2 [Phycicoccus elongatus Lp2]HOA67209.1 cytochrome c oxidase subunit II [Phycicoccus elongatus]
MRQRDHVVPRSRSRALRVGVLSVIAALTLTGCEQGQFVNGFLPQGVTEGADRVTTLWVWSWVALFGVGFLVWGLIIWCMVAYRRRKDDNELPVQLRYNVPIEILYTVVPIFMIATFFYYTARDESALLDTAQEPDVSINVVGKQWSWDFNYVDEQVHETGAQAILTGEPGAEETIPTLYLPVGERVQFYLTARDVIHSFWVPQFLQKMDMIPGRVNTFQVTPTQEGTFKGKCAELCGAYHSAMLFNVKVVSRSEYDAHMAELKAKGQTGLLPNGLSRQQLMKGQEKLLPENARG